MNLPQDLLQQVLRSAEIEYPRECCGFLVRSEKARSSFRSIAVRNAQDDLHAQDPAVYPRTSRNAYVMDSKELLRAHKAMRVQGETIYAIYHSHPDQEAFFSLEDQRLALDDQGQPVYANAFYLVVSVKLGRAAGWKLFHWDKESKEFKE